MTCEAEATKMTTARRWRQMAGAAVVLLLFASAGARGQGVGLAAVLEMARSTDAQYAAARAAAQAAMEKLPQAIALMRPNVNFSYSVKRHHDGSSAYPGTLRYDAGGAALTINQPLFRVPLKVGAEQAEYLQQAAEKQFALAEQELIGRVARGYFNVLQAQDELAAATAQREALVQQLAQAKRSFEVGTVPVTDFNEAQARHDIGVAQEIAARNELESKKRTLEKSLARPLPQLMKLRRDASVDLLGPDLLDQLVRAAPRDALQVSIGRFLALAAEREISKREAGHHATLDFQGTIRRDRNVNFGQFGGNDTRQNSFGVELNFPLYQGGLISSRTREAIAEHQKALHDLTDAERQAQLEAHQAQLGVESGRALVQALQQALASSETQLKSTQRGLQVGVRTRVDVLNAEQQLFATRKDLASARYRTLVAGLQLRAAAGALAEADLRVLDTLLSD